MALPTGGPLTETSDPQSVVNVNTKDEQVATFASDRAGQSPRIPSGYPHPVSGWAISAKPYGYHSEMINALFTSWQ